MPHRLAISYRRGIEVINDGHPRPDTSRQGAHGAQHGDLPADHGVSCRLGMNDNPASGGTITNQRILEINVVSS
ncbi:protein of unknown function [Paraburkholderia dioscoreae]|uniref:Uncharacterized protein n=1 Tax=Paraburkholderia dioscoreae TaxID=2604047 RepID=A0A5Q4ZS00_9BURK|nr:protein of unknown function [Paraburkholderia dioscoreae]